MATIEYRKLFRANVSLRVGYKAIKDAKIEGITFSRNISSTGINVLIPDCLKEGDELSLEIFLPEETKPLLAKGKVIWQSLCSYQPKSGRRYYSTGLHVVEMSTNDAVKTSDFISDILRRQKEREDTAIIERIESILGGKIS